MHSSIRLDRCRGALLGLAVADALGAPLEFRSPEEARAAVDGGLEMTGGGLWAAGEWTDDTAMMLRLAESIAEHGLLDVDDVARRYAAWVASGPKDVGVATAAALRGATSAEEARSQARSHLERTGSGAGNGTVMRAAPIGLAARTHEEATTAARADAELTHGDPRAAEASACLCAALVAVCDGEEPGAAARRIARSPEVVDALAADATELAALAAGRAGGACWTALGVALHALTAIDDYERGVLWAISLGRDTDTNAAVAGALLGARHGVESVPERWLLQLLDRERVERAAEGIAAR